MKKNLIFFFVLIIIFFFLFLLTFREIYGNKNLLINKEKIFDIKKGESIIEIASNLEKEKIIENKFSFVLYLFLKGDEKKIQAGKYLLDPNLKIYQMVDKFIFGDTIKIKITIPEGYNLKEVEQEFKKNFKEINFSKFKIGDFKNDFEILKDVPDEASLEGFLFPDTYFFNSDATEKEIIYAFLKNFSQKITPDLQKEIKNQNKSLYEITIIASLIEKEVKTLEDKKIVSGILWKRLKYEIPLQVDATISYITGKKTTKISLKETQIDSLYNTYKYKGLPKGPISNPGIESIIAAIYPKETEFFFYLSKPDGETIFSRNAEEHIEAVEKYLR